MSNPSVYEKIAAHNTSDVQNQQVAAIPPISQADVIAAQNMWGQAIVNIGKAYQENGDYTALAIQTIDTLYSYDEGPVLFKPTRATEQPFRFTKQDALSYFVTGSIAEDTGFAIQPWSKVRFDNAHILIDRNKALAMGHYYFTDANTNEEVKVEYTFGYHQNAAGKLLIHLQHSSIPFNPS